MFIETEVFLETHERPAFGQFTLRDVNPVSKNEKTRKISNPNSSMRQIHRRIIQALDGLNLWNEFDMSDSPYRNVNGHTANRYFYQTDLSNAFGGVDLDRMVAVLVSLKPKWNLGEVREILARYCFEESGKGLIVGAPASPKLFNIFASEAIDIPLNKFWPYTTETKILRRRYSRYFDDLTFSSPEPISENTRRHIRQIIEEAGFQVNHRKSTLSDLCRGPIVITGIGLEWRDNKRARLFLPRHFLKRMNGLLHLALKRDPRVSRSEVEGMMGVFYGVFGNKRRERAELNATELNFLKKYAQFRAMYNQRR